MKAAPTPVHSSVIDRLFLYLVNSQVIFGSALVELGFDLLVDKAFVILEILLYVNFEFDHVIENLLNLRVQFFAQRVGAQG